MKVKPNERIVKKCYVELKALSKLTIFSIDNERQINKIVYALNEYELVNGLDNKDTVSRLLQKVANSSVVDSL